MKDRDAPRPDGRPYVLKAVAQSFEHSQVREELEQVNGRWCHVLEWPDYDRLWIDVDRGCSLLARETHDAASGDLVQRIEVGGHREAAPGVWLPSWMKNIQYDFLAPTKEGRKRRVIDARMDILEFSVNDVTDRVFRFKPPAGTLKIESAKLREQVAPGGLEHLDHLAAWVKKYTPPSEPPSEESWPFLAAVLLIVLIALWQMGHLTWGNVPSIVKTTSGLAGLNIKQ